MFDHQSLRSRRIVSSLFIGLFALGRAATAEDAPPPAVTPTPDATPAVRFGATIFSDLTFLKGPLAKDVDGNPIHANAFDVSRAYFTVMGSLSSRISLRVTADVKRLASMTSAAATSVDGSASLRLKYAYGQIGLDGVLPKGSWIRIGAQQTPLIDAMEPFYRYRFQGTQMIEREGYLSSSDFGISGRVNFPREFGDVHVGLYNGESYAKGEVNDQKALQIRATARPWPRHAVLKGLRLTAFHDADHYVKNAVRTRSVANAVFEHKYAVVGADVLRAKDRTSSSAPLVESSAYSVWARPRTSIGVEGLLRYDSVRPDRNTEARRSRRIVGVGYWFKTPPSVSAALLADYERATFGSTSTRPAETRFALHCLFAF